MPKNPNDRIDIPTLDALREVVRSGISKIGEKENKTYLDLDNIAKAEEFINLCEKEHYNI